MLSGFIIFWIHRNDLGNRSKIVAYATKRITRIYPLLWVVVLTKAFVALVVPALMATLEIDAMTLLASLFLIPHERVMLDVQWTLFYEVQFYLIFGTWICLGRWFACAIALIWAGAILALGPASGHVALRQLLDLRNMEFLGGCSIAFLMSRSFLPWRGAVVVTGGAVAGTLAGISLGYGHPLFWTLVFGALVAGAVSLDSSQRLNWPRWMVYIGDASYSIYLWHTSVQMLFLQVGKKWAVPFGEYGHVLLHAGGLLSVLLGLVSYRFVEKPILTWFGSRRSLGSRRG